MLAGRNTGPCLDNPRKLDILALEGISLDSASQLEVQKHFESALLCAARGEVDEAIAELREVTRALPGSAPAHGRLGVLLSEKGLSEEAVLEFEAALAADPADSGAQFQLAMLQDKLGRRADALGAFEGFLAAAGAGGAEHAEFARRRSAELRRLLGMRPSPGSRPAEEAKEDRGGGFAFQRGEGDKRSLSGAAALLRGWGQALRGLSWGPGALLVGVGLAGAVAFICLPRVMGRGDSAAPAAKPAPQQGFPGAREQAEAGSRRSGEGPGPQAQASSIDLLERANARPAQAEAPAAPPQAAPSVDPTAPAGAAPKAARPAPRRAASAPTPAQLQGGGAWGGVGRAFKGGFRDPRAARAGDGAKGDPAPSGTLFRDLAAPLINRKVGDRNVTANKAMGQLKFAGKQSAKSMGAGSAARAAALTDDAFNQEESGAQGGKGLGCARTRRAVAGDMLTVKTGACQGGGEDDWEPGKVPGCPEGMAHAPGGGCRPVGELQGTNVTTYQKDVDRAKSLSDEASRLTNDSNPITRELNRKKAKKLSEQASELGKQIRTASGQKDQGELIEDVSDQSNERSNIGAGAARAREREKKLDKTLKDSKGDDDANAESAAGYR